MNQTRKDGLIGRMCARQDLLSTASAHADFLSNLVEVDHEFVLRMFDADSEESFVGHGRFANSHGRFASGHGHTLSSSHRGLDDVCDYVGFV